MNTSFLRKYHTLLFFGLWLLLQLVQAGTTELFHDEAYYWVYSKFPAWGYFDHPPMIAILIKAGYSLFHNELGVRLLIVFMSTFTLMIIYQLLPRKNDGLFYAIACSIALLQLGGIIAAPDIPLGFFVALFFLCYKRFAEKSTVLNSLLLGVVMALMLYSKYHGILIILFTFISDLSNFKKWQSYLAAFICIVLFVPHLYWQYTHNFPSVQYHLFERSVGSYSFIHTLEYIGGQLLLAGPLTGWLLLWAAFNYKPVSPFERALKFSMAGFYLFFLVSTLKGRVEANWTIPAFIPLIILSHQYLLHADKLRNILIRTIPFILLLIVPVRLYMMADTVPVKIRFKDEFHDNKICADSITKKAEGLPVVFLDSYQSTSRYWFYSGLPSFSLNTVLYRRNNYNFWPLEDAFAGRTIYLVDDEDKGDIRIKNFHSFSKVDLEHKGMLNVKNGMVSDTITVSTPVYTTISIPDTLLDKEMQLFVYHEGDVIANFPSGITLRELLSGKKVLVSSYAIDIPSGIYQARYALPCSVEDEYTINSKYYKLVVE